MMLHTKYKVITFQTPLRMFGKEMGLKLSLPRLFPLPPLVFLLILQDGNACSTWPNLAQSLPAKHRFQVLCIFLSQSSCLFSLLATVPSPSLERKINAEFHLIISLCIDFFVFSPAATATMVFPGILSAP